MTEQAAQAIDDGKTETEAAVRVAAGESLEFAEDIVLLILRDTRPAVPHVAPSG
jgi:hypothetical protein